MAMITLFPEREERWAEERRRKPPDSADLVQSSDGIWRTVAERSAFEAQRMVMGPFPKLLGDQ